MYIRIRDSRDGDQKGEGDKAGQRKERRTTLQRGKKNFFFLKPLKSGQEKSPSIFRVYTRARLYISIGANGEIKILQ